jgi:hypothetical protein
MQATVSDCLTVGFYTRDKPTINFKTIDRSYHFIASFFAGICIISRLQDRHELSGRNDGHAIVLLNVK